MIPHTHETYLHSVRQSIPLCGISESTVQLIAVPVCHSMSARSPGFLGVLAVGGTVVLAPNGSPDSVFPLIEEHRITQSSVVPPIVLAWLNSSLKERYDLSSLESLHVGGARLSARRPAGCGPSWTSCCSRASGWPRAWSTTTRSTSTRSGA